MPDPLAALEAQRDGILREIARLGDMRKGSLTETFRPCGKPTCACHRRDHPGHGPYYAFTTKVEGRTRTVQLRPGSRLDKFQREVDAYKQFRALSEKLIEINEALCAARPAPAEPDARAAGKKTSRRSSRTRSSRKSAG
jgi:hypothetical protein